MLDRIASCVGVGLEVLEPRSLYDPALVGVVFRGSGLVCGYDSSRLFEILMELNEGWDEVDAREWVVFNASGKIALLDVLL